jgi:hypothetical protein
MSVQTDHLAPGSQPPSTAPSLDEVIERRSADAGLSTTRRRDLVSALRRICALLERDPRVVPADVAALRAALNRISPARHGLAPKTWSNLKANLLAGLRHGMSGGARERIPVSPEWRALQARLADKRMRNGLSRFMRFCSARALPPEAVDDAVMMAFRAWAETETLVPDVNDLLRRTSRLWNEACRTVPGWPAAPVSVPDNRPPRRRPAMADLPASFVADVEAYLAMRANPDPFDPEAPNKGLKSRTVRLRRDQLRVAAGALAGC